MDNSPAPPEQPTTNTEEAYLDRALNPPPEVGESKTHYIAPEKPPHGSEKTGTVARRRQARPE